MQSQDKIFYKSFFILTLGVALQNVLAFGVNLSDGVLLGAYSENALAGVAIVNQIQFILQMVIMGVGEGVVVLSSRFWGRKELEPIERVTSIGLRVGLLFSLIIWAVVFFWTKPCISILTNDPGVIAPGEQYAQIICFSYMFFAITNILLACMRSVETVKIGLYVSLSTLLINITLNLILIYGNLGMPRMGIRGSAVATLVARIIETCIVSIYVFKIDKKLKLKMSAFFKRIDFTLFRQYLKTGMPVIGGNFSWGIAMAVQTAIIGHLGLMTIAANSIASTAFQLISVFAYGAGSAATVLTAKTVGQGDLNQVKSITRKMQILFILIGVVTGILVYVLRYIIVGFYAVPKDTVDLSLQFLGILAITVVGTAYQMPCLTGIVRGGGDTKFVLINDIIFMWGIVLPVSILAAFVWNLTPLIVFACLKSDQILKCVVAVVKVNRFSWIKKIKIKKIDTDILSIES
jgi:putative efflux protein, MATE family